MEAFDSTTELWYLPSLLFKPGCFSLWDTGTHLGGLESLFPATPLASKLNVHGRLIQREADN